MRKILASLVLVGALVVPATTASAAEVSTAPPAVEQDMQVEIGGAAYGPSWCYVYVDYFYITPTVQSRPPYLTIDSGGSVGAEVHCPLPPLGNWT